MNVVPRQTLRRIIEKYGNSLCGDARRCENLLKDLCGSYRREINVLTSAVEERIALDLVAEGSMPRQLLLHKLAKRLEDNRGITQESARWAVDTWAFALGIISEEQIEIGEKERHTLPVMPLNTDSKISKNQSRDSQTKPVLSTSKVAPSQPSEILPPVASAPVNFPQSKTSSGKLNTNITPNSSLPVNSPINVPASKKWSRRFSGCLFALLLMIVIGTGLLFGVPYAIKVMRETQQSEPPRFPPN